MYTQAPCSITKGLDFFGLLFNYVLYVDLRFLSREGDMHIKHTGLKNSSSSCNIIDEHGLRLRGNRKNYIPLALVQEILIAPPAAVEEDCRTNFFPLSAFESAFLSEGTERSNPCTRSDHDYWCGYVGWQVEFRPAYVDQ
jgi:hypothetical protein